MALFGAISAGFKLFKGLVGQSSAKRKLKKAQAKLKKAQGRLEDVGVQGSSTGGKIFKNVAQKIVARKKEGAFREVNSLGTSGAQGSEDVQAKFTSNTMKQVLKKVPVWGWIVGAVVLIGTLIAIFRKKRR